MSIHEDIPRISPEAVMVEGRTDESGIHNLCYSYHIAYLIMCKGQDVKNNVMAKLK